MHTSIEIEQTIVKIYLFDTNETHGNLLPLSFTRPVADFRCGILTIREKWENYFPGDYSFFPVDYLREKYGNITDEDEEAVFISGNLLPRPDIVELTGKLNSGEAYVKNGSQKDSSDSILESIIVFKGSYKNLVSGNFKTKTISFETFSIQQVYDIFQKNAEEIIRDFQLITKDRKSQPIPSHVRKISTQGVKNIDRLIFIEKGAKVECASINISKGPVYIGKDSVLMEGSCIRGPFALCEYGEVRMGARIYEATTVGPHCKVGGEVSNTVFFGYSNKAHDGYLGNAVIGEWCNIGAGTNASNLKNDYTLIKVWNYRKHSFVKTDLQFCGVIMGDHSKIGVNCMINTATVLGVGVNIHGAGFPRNFVPCFHEGSATTGLMQVPLQKFIDIMSRMMSRRDVKPTKSDLAILTHIYDES